MIKEFTKYELRNKETDKETHLVTNSKHMPVYLGKEVLTKITWEEAVNLLSEERWIITKEESVDLFKGIESNIKEKKGVVKLKEWKRYVIVDKTDNDKELVVKTGLNNKSVAILFNSQVDGLPQLDQCSFVKANARIELGHWAVKQELDEYDL
ncbi:hypothetical protein COF68_05430 [Bacillus toyonensis]|uniref:hypothetical protein n=1 Tax=Bacillus toyonensis TaxID=155322 RepID=UPI000BFD5DC9|nr:hypothetical protein [Bacillus toyonensis]PHE64284.1 hypothetical protein COF68_05430 [Bacillus toyonensis]